MKKQPALSWLIPLTGILALIVAGVGLFWQNGGGPFPFITLHGETVQMSGQGIYAYDTYFKAPIFRGTDAVTLFVGIPLLLAAALLYRRGSLRGGILLAGVLSYFLYNSASMALGVAYNNLFLVYTAYFSASLFAFGLACRSIDLQVLSSHVSAGLPRRGIAVLMFVSGLALMAAWLIDIVAALVQGRVPAIASYTTEVTYAIDLGIITPLTVLAGIQILRRAPVSYLLAPIMLILLAIIGLVVAAQTVSQSLAGITLSVGEFIGKAGSFMTLAGFAAWLLVRFFRSLSEARPVQPKPGRTKSVPA